MKARIATGFLAIACLVLLFPVRHGIAADRKVAGTSAGGATTTSAGKTTGSSAATKASGPGKANAAGKPPRPGKPQSVAPRPGRPSGASAATVGSAASRGGTARAGGANPTAGAPGAGRPAFGAKAKAGAARAEAYDARARQPMGPGNRAPGGAALATVRRIAWRSAPAAAEVSIFVDGTVHYEGVPGPEGSSGAPTSAVIEIEPARMADGMPRAPTAVKDGLLSRVRASQVDARTVRILVETTRPVGFTVRNGSNPPRIVVSLELAAVPTPAPVVVPAVLPTPEPSLTAVPPPKATPLPVAAVTPGPVAQPHALVTAIPTLLPRAVPEPTARAVPSLDEPARAAVPPPGSGTPAAAAESVEPTPGPLPAGMYGGGQDTAGEVAPPGEPEPVIEEPEEPGAALRDVSPPASRRTGPRVVVLDPGHGGRDPGARGPTSAAEKQVTLAVAKLVAQRLAAEPGIRVLLTRNGDRTVSLRERTAYANARAADLFVSIHANASENTETWGVETYTLNNTQDRATIRLAKMENGLSVPGVGRDDRNLAFIVSDLLQTGKEEESIALAESIQSGIVSRVRTGFGEVPSLGVKKGPFYVLVGAHMPCVLTEIGFVSHAEEGRRVSRRGYQEAVAEGIARGVLRFLSSGAANSNL